MITNGDEYKEAKLQELEMWKALRVYEIVEDLGQERIDTKWVLTMKEDPITKTSKRDWSLKVFKTKNSLSMRKHHLWYQGTFCD